jgi:hypothetical protein
VRRAGLGDFRINPSKREVLTKNEGRLHQQNLGLNSFFLSWKFTTLGLERQWWRYQGYVTNTSGSVLSFVSCFSGNFGMIPIEFVFLGQVKTNNVGKTMS